MDMTTSQMSVATVDSPVPASCGCGGGNGNGTACAVPAPFGGDEELHTLAKQIAALPPEKAQQLRDFIRNQTAG